MAGLAMLLMMALLRLFLGWPTPTELIFDRFFPLLTVEFFISSLVRAGGYTPLKLQGVFGALAGPSDRRRSWGSDLCILSQAT